MAGSELQPQTVRVGKIGTHFKIKAPTIAGYKLISAKTQGKTAGIFGTDTQGVVFVYMPSNVIYHDVTGKITKAPKDGNVISMTLKTGTFAFGKDFKARSGVYQVAPVDGSDQGSIQVVDKTGAIVKTLNFHTDEDTDQSDAQTDTAVNDQLVIVKGDKITVSLAHGANFKPSDAGTTPQQAKASSQQKPKATPKIGVLENITKTILGATRKLIDFF